MKHLVLILALAISTQPLQAGFCDMDMGNAQDNQHQMDGAADAGHDCCDTDDADTQQAPSCDGKSHCAPCFVSTPAFPAMARFYVDWASQHPPGVASSLTLTEHASPPFRPPIL